MSKPPSLAKLSAPRLSRIVARPRLFHRLERAGQRRVVWLVGPPGAGKTALAASWLRSRKLRHLWLQVDEADGDVATFFHYLALAARKLVPERRRLPVFTPEFLAAPGAFARRFFRALCAGTRPPAVIVLEDYHEVRGDSSVHAALRDGFEELPEGVVVVVLSRCEPPAPLARLQANGLLEVTRGDDLAVTEGEASEIAALWGYSPRDGETVLALHARTEGWAAGLVLLLAGGRSSTGEERGCGDEGLFDYFAQEVLDRSDPDTRRVLVETALLERVEGPLAAHLTGVDRAEEILAGLSRRGCFVARHEASYRYHALFREFLLGRAAKALSPQRHVELQRSAAGLLEECDRAEEAFRLYVQAGAWAEAGRIIRARAPLLMRQGRAQTVALWVGCVPAEVRDRDPWLLLHLGEALSTLDPPGADLTSLERAFDLFLAADDAPGAYLAWAAIAEAYLCGLREATPLDGWISKLDDLRVRFPDFGGLEIEMRVAAAAFYALCNRQPWHDALPGWEKRALSLALSPGAAHLRVKVGRALMFHYGGCVNDLAKARLVVDALRPLVLDAQADPATAIVWHIAEAVWHVHLGHADACLEAVDRGLAMSADSGVHAADVLLLQMRVFASLQTGDLVAAERAVREMTGLPGFGVGITPCVHQFCSVLLARRRGDAAMAREHARTCRELVAALGLPQAEILFGVACVLAGAPESIEAELVKLLLQARRCGNRFVQATTLLALASRVMRRGDPERASSLLRDGFAVARDLGCLYFVYFEPSELAGCCALALERGIEPEYVRELVRALRLPPCDDAHEMEAWPWDVRIEALGDLAVIRNEERVRPGRKAQKKPLEMLRLLVAHGADGMRQDVLAEALWPDAEGDAAAHALGTTVYRLRRLLGKMEAVVRRDGRIALDPQRVFVDAWALERLLARIRAARARGADGGLVAELCGRARSLYRGDLFGDEDHPLLADARERLREQMARHLPVSGPAEA